MDMTPDEKYAFTVRLLQEIARNGNSKAIRGLEVLNEPLSKRREASKKPKGEHRHDGMEKMLLMLHDPHGKRKP